MRLWVFLAASCLLLTACMEFRLPTTATALRQGEPVRIGDNTWAAYQRYLETIGTTGQGAFAIASDGKGRPVAKSAPSITDPISVDMLNHSTPK